MYFHPRNLKEYLPQIVDEELTKGAVAATLFIGANDANDPDINPMQHVPVEEFKVGQQD